MASQAKPDLMAIFAAHNLLTSIDKQEAAAFDPIKLQIFESVPGWAIVQAARDNRNAPMVRTGEVVVAERGAGWMPTVGGLFVIEYVTPPATEFALEERRREIVQTWDSPIGWWAGAMRRGGANGPFFAADGPYTDPCDLARKIVGRVVGILETPSFTRRMAGNAGGR